MLRILVLRALVALRLVDRPELVVRIVDRHPAPEDLRSGEMIVVRERGRQKWGCLLCPGDCGERIQLALTPHRRPRWLIRLDFLGRPSVTPSVRQINSCQCHFRIVNGNVRWCGDSGPDARLAAEPQNPE